jgi:hypothetical protein
MCVPQTSIEQTDNFVISLHKVYNLKAQCGGYDAGRLILSPKH